MMKKYILILFFSGHLLLIFLRGIWTTIDGYSSYHYNERPYIPVLANYIADTKIMVEADSTFTENDSTIVRFRKDYIKKSLKWMGRKQAEASPYCTSYKIELLTILPHNATLGQPNIKPKLHVIEEGLFPIQ